MGRFQFQTKKQKQSAFLPHVEHNIDRPLQGFYALLMPNNPGKTLRRPSTIAIHHNR